jgi:hypothetical protein
MQKSALLEISVFEMHSCPILALQFWLRRQPVQGANVNGVVSGLALDTADFPLDGRGVLPLGEDDPLLP